MENLFHGAEWVNPSWRKRVNSWCRLTAQLLFQINCRTVRTKRRGLYPLAGTSRVFQDRRQTSLCLPPARSQVEKAITDFNEKDPVNEGYPRFVELHVFSEVGGDTGVGTFLFKVIKTFFQFLPQKCF